MIIFCFIVNRLIKFDQFAINLSMIKVSDRIALWLEAHPTHAQFLSEGLINASALARTIQPEIQKQTGASASLDSIILSLNRQAKTIKHAAPKVEQTVDEVSIQPNLSLIVLPNSELDGEMFSKAIAILHKTKEYALYTHGVWHTSLTGKQSVVQELAAHFQHTTLTHDLLAVTAKLMPADTTTVSYASLLQKLAQRNIATHAVYFSHNELTVIIAKADANGALECFV